MGRWEPDARERLQRAALALFTEQGFASTTVPQITARAGLTTRTFFRYFADKREVLFADEERLPALVRTLMATAPASAEPIEVIAYGLDALVTEVFEGRADYLRVRRRIIESDGGLQERELRKLASLSGEIREGFLQRGVDELTATLAADLAVSTFRAAVGRWLGDDDGRELAEHVHQALQLLGAIVCVPRRA